MAYGDGIIDSFYKGYQFGQLQKEQRRKNAIAEAFQSAYEPGTPGTPGVVGYGGEEYEPVEPVQAQAPTFNIQNAVAQLYKGGYGPEAFEVQNKASQNEIARLMAGAQYANAIRPKLGEAKSGLLDGKETFFRTDDRGNTYDLSGKQISGNLQPRPQVPLVNLDMKGDEAFARELAKKQAEQYQTNQEAAGISQSLLDTVQRGKQLLPEVRTGFGAGAEATTGSAMRALGMAPSSFGLMDPAKAEEFQAVSSQSVGLIRQVLKFPAAGFSDADRMMLEKAVSGLNKNPEANLAIFDAAEKVAQRQQEQTSAMDEWIAKNKNLNGFNSYWTKYNREHPLFPKAEAKPKPSMGPTQPQPGKTIDGGYIYLGGDPANPKSWKPLR